jgi:cellulose synthase (UDP-forming)
MRRAALDRVGGFETATPSEDLATGIRITAAGYRNHYLSEKLSAGLAPLTAAAMAQQRCRWGSGSLQTLRTGANPLRIPGLNLIQRLAYSEGILHWFSYLAQLVLMATPLSLGLLGVAPILIQGDALLSMALPFYLSQMLLSRWFSNHSRTAILPELYRWIFLMPICAAVLATVLGRPRQFKVTPKALTSARHPHVDRGLLLPLLLLLSLQVLALWHLAPGRLPPPLLAGTAPLPPISATTVSVLLAWGSLNVVMLLLAIRSCWDRPGGDGVPWFALSLPLRLHLTEGEVPARLFAISESGAELRLARSSAERIAPLDIHLLLEGLVPDASLPFTLLAQRPGALGGLWGPLTPWQRRQLQSLLYQRQGLWPTLRAPFEPRALAAVVLRLLQPVRPEAWFSRSLIPQVPPLIPLRLTSPAGFPAVSAGPDPAR